MPYNPTMLKNRIIPALGLAGLVPLVALAQTPNPSQTPLAPTASPAPLLPPTTSQLLAPPTAPTTGTTATADKELPTEAEKALDEAINKVRGLKSVSTDIVQKVEMLGQNFELKGQYLKAPNYRIYLKLTLSGLGDTAGIMLQVCDGQILWDYQQVLNGQAYQKFDITKVIKRLEGPEFDPETRQKILVQMGFSGPEALLVGLRNSLKFDGKEDDKLDGKAVWVLRGKWKDMGKLTAPNQPKLPPEAPLPAYVPSIATVWIGQDDGWPYQVRLEGRVPSILEDTRQIGADGTRVGPKRLAQPVQTSKILLTYSNVRLDLELKPESFAFQAPPNADVLDLTQQYLNYLDQASAMMQAEKKKAEASKESELPQSIAVPRPSLDEPPPTKAPSAPPR